jgi:hypothetical protein
MSHSFDLSCVAPLRERLNQHPIYRSLRDLDDVRGFMSQHVYSVWDFMSLLKTLQQAVAPAGAPWAPVGSPMLRRFINEIVLEEESDEGLPDASGNKTYASHFELYCQAMCEVGADDGAPRAFVAAVQRDGIRTALTQNLVPMAARWFMETTFGFISTGKPHVVAAAFALGREQVIPGMFRALLKDMQVREHEAPAFHYYLERHIHLDEDHHGPLSLRMLDELCAGDPRKLREAEQAARAAIEARIEFWDGVLSALQRARADANPRLAARG